MSDIGDVAAFLDDILLLAQLLHQRRTAHRAADKARPVLVPPPRPLGIGLDRRSRPPHVQCRIGDMVMAFLHNAPDFLQHPLRRTMQELRQFALLRKVPDIPHPPEHLGLNLSVRVILRLHKLMHLEILRTARVQVPDPPRRNRRRSHLDDHLIIRTKALIRHDIHIPAFSLSLHAHPFIAFSGNIISIQAEE